MLRCDRNDSTEDRICGCIRFDVPWNDDAPRSVAAMAIGCALLVATTVREIAVD